MSSTDAIGGYFGLEPKSTNGHNIHDESILLNTARNCFEYILRTRAIRHVYMPAYTCSVVFEPLDKLRISYSTYEINTGLEIANLPNVALDEAIVYTNYFGLKDTYCDELARLFGDKLILDCSQALYYRPNGNCHVFYSPRKFVGLADGGCLYTSDTLGGEVLPIDTDSEKRSSHLYIRHNESAEAGYADFVKNDTALSGQPIKKMSQLTRSTMDAIDFQAVRCRRKRNFAYLCERLGDKLLIGDENWDSVACPMIFPLWASNELRQKLITQRIYTATYWPNIFEDLPTSSTEYAIASNLVALPIDQRYNETHMQRIVEAIDGYTNPTASN